MWHFQTVHHGLWDYDNPAAPNLLDITVNGTRIKALAQITQAGFRLHVRSRHRQTGVADRREAGAGLDVPGEKASPTQPIPSKPAPFEYQGVTVDDLADFTPEIRAMAEEADRRIQDRAAVHAAARSRGTLVRPGATGGANWSGAAVDPATGMLYVPSRNCLRGQQAEPPDKALDSNLLLHADAGRAIRRCRQGLPLFKPPYSRMTAIDMNTGNHAWMVPTGAGDRIRSNPR